MLAASLFSIRLHGALGKIAGTPMAAMTTASGIENLYGSSGKNQNVASAANAAAATRPPTSPSHVFPAEIFGASLCFPNARPAK